MIHDGYNRHVVLNRGIRKHRIIYRPALADEVARFRYESTFLEEGPMRSFCQDFISAHVALPAFMREDLNQMEQKDEAGFTQLYLTIIGELPDESGERWKDLEKAWRHNLISGVKLELANPRLANRDCASCKTLWYSEITGLPILNGDGSPMMRSGPTMCETPMGCEKGTPDNLLSFNKANRWAWKHFCECDAVGHFPDDPIVRYNARIIRQAIANYWKGKSGGPANADSRSRSMGTARQERGPDRGRPRSRSAEARRVGQGTR